MKDIFTPFAVYRSIEDAGDGWANTWGLWLDPNLPGDGFPFGSVYFPKTSCYFFKKLADAVDFSG